MIHVELQNQVHRTKNSRLNTYVNGNNIPNLTASCLL